MRERDWDSGVQTQAQTISLLNLPPPRLEDGEPLPLRRERQAVVLVEGDEESGAVSVPVHLRRAARAPTALSRRAICDCVPSQVEVLSRLAG